MHLTLALGALVVASVIYYGAALIAMVRSWRRTHPATGPHGATVGVSLLKPAVGAGPTFLDLLRSHAVQDHPDFEILIGVGPGDSAARDAARAIQAEFPTLRVETVDCPEEDSRQNGKAMVLERLAQRASKPVWVVTDADIRVPQGYLRVLCSELGRPNTGLVTCLYRGESNGSMASRLEAARINTEFPAQVLLAQWLQGLRFALGSTLAIHRDTLRDLGGFGALRQHVGDDYRLGAMVAAGGQRVEVSALPVAMRSERGNGTANVWDRQLRWSRTIRKQRPAGHAGLVITFATVWSALAVLLQPAALWPLAVLGLTSRMAAGAVSARLVGRAPVGRDLLLVPIADIAAFAVWACSYCGSSVNWAGRQMRLGSGGRILP